MKSAPRNAPCPCGSGKKYKLCCVLKEDMHRQVLRGMYRALKWIGGTAAVILFIYLIFQNGSKRNLPSYQPISNQGLQGGRYYTDSDIDEVDFSGLNQEQKRRVLNKANKLLCTCGCGMTLAQCLAIDSTCPLRDSNIKLITDLIKEESLQK